ncbi:MAG: hypothetical protein GX783_12690 [Clostridiales bacterium]|nr:hypothetical protein [Clostridiales bacterium]
MLRITQRFAQIGIETKNAQLFMQSKKPQLNMSQQHVKVEISRELPRVLIDQYQCFAEAGLKNNMDLLKEAAYLARQQAMEYIGKVASDGDVLAAIENGGNPIAYFAERDAYPEKEFNMVTMPTSRPRFEVVGDVRYNVRPGGVQYDFERGNVEIEATPPELNIYLRQKPFVKFEFVGKNMDIYL